MRTRLEPSAAPHDTSIVALLRHAWRNTLVQVGWPQGPAFLLSGIIAALLLDFIPSFGADRETIGLIVGAAGLLWLAVFLWNLCAVNYTIQKSRAERAERELRSLMVSATQFGPEQLQRALAQYYRSAHTFLYYDLETKVSLSQNVKAIEVHWGNEISIHFLQALDPGTIVVRPLGGTPKLEVLEAKCRKLRIRLLRKSPFVRLRIFGDIIPTIKNHGPGSDAMEIAVPAQMSETTLSARLPSDSTALNVR